MDLLKEYWGMVVAGITFIIWLARLEYKVKGNEKDLAEVKRLNKEEFDDLKTVTHELRQSIEKLNGMIHRITGFIEGREKK